MPKIEVSHKDLCSLIGRKLSTEQLADELLYAKSELDEINGDTLKIDVKDVNRPDLWSAEGVAREIRARYKKDFPSYKIKSSGIIVNVDRSVEGVRPYTACAVVKGLKINDVVMSQLLQLQEKVAGTFGRNRKEVAIGIYDLDKIKSPITYAAKKPEAISFVPLDSKQKLTAREILEKHPKGREFGHLLGSMYPLFTDASGEVLSMPPIINSDHSGRVTTSTSSVFIECSGFEMKFLNVALNVIVAALQERGGSIYSVKVNYIKPLTTPDLQPKKFYVNADYISKLFGIELEQKKLLELLQKSLYLPKITGKRIELLYPAYRQDIMHDRDVAEDVMITYGFNEIEPLPPRLLTKGGLVESHKLEETAADIMTGIGFQEILSYTLTNIGNLYEKMNTTGDFIEIEKPTSSNWSVFRTWMTPSLLEFLSKNMHVEYPHQIFEIGNTVVKDPNSSTRAKDIMKMAAAVSATTVSYEMISSQLDALLRNLGIPYVLKKSTHPSLIDGRTAEIIVNKKPIGFIGEIHPQILNNWQLEKPVVVFEINLEDIFEVLKNRK